jgi:hypothetical protein
VELGEESRRSYVPQAGRPVARSPADATRKLKGRRYLLTADLEREFKRSFQDYLQMYRGIRI